MNERDIFIGVLELESLEEQAAFLNQACAGDSSLRERVEALLRSHAKGNSLLENPPAAIADPTLDQPITEKPGTQIGPYKLLQKVGEGGMGVVYMAEQKKPVKRRVALKIIKPGMDTRQVNARFEAERQALAMMDHPNIAKVLDAGQTESGRPYFVMELVNGLPVTKYCDQQHLTPKERLELFVPICQAVQHAHQKGIIHRDLKPSNILVAMYDNKAVPKIIDFGVAKATSQTLTEKTMFTQLGQVVGTLEYMAPEQAQVNQLDVDTRSDVYSLGVVLYELLTGETPFDRARLRSAAFDEMLRIIREEEPSKPSTKVSSSLSLPSIAANRRIEPAKLGSMIRGELDWIVLKAMEKDRGRRDETASKFAEDVQHYLNDEAVVACPPSRAYRFRKFARRNKFTIGTVAAISAAITLGMVGTAWQAYQASSERDRALAAESRAEKEAERANREAHAALLSKEAAETDAAIAREVNDFVNSELLGRSNPHSDPNRGLTVREVLDRASLGIEGRFPEQPLVEAAVRTTIGTAYSALGEPTEAARHLERAVEIRGAELGENAPETLGTHVLLIETLKDRGLVTEAISDLEATITKATYTLGPDHRITLSARMLLAFCRLSVGQDEDAERLALEVLRLSSDDGSRVGHGDLMVLATTLMQRGALAQAEDMQRRAFEYFRDNFGSEYPNSMRALGGLANVVSCQGRYAEAESMRRSLLEIQQRVLGKDHPDTIATSIDLAWEILKLERFPEAEMRFREALPVVHAIRGEDHEHTIIAKRGLAISSLKQGKYIEAESLFRELLQWQEGQIDLGNAEAVGTMVWLAQTCHAQGKFDDAEQLLRDVLAIDDSHFRACVELAQLLLKRDLEDEAIELLERAEDNCPNSYSAYNRLGLAFRSSGEFERAITLFLKCIEMDPDAEAAPYNLILTYLDCGKFSQTIEFMDSRAADWPQLRGRALIALADYDKAVSCLRTKPSDGSPQSMSRERRRLFALALQCYALRNAVGDDASPQALVSAEAMARESLQVTPGPGDAAMAILSFVQYRVGQTTEARCSLNDALSRNPKNPIAQLVSALLSLDDEEYQLAASQLQSAEEVMRDRASPNEEIARLLQNVRDAVNTSQTKKRLENTSNRGKPSQDESNSLQTNKKSGR